MNKKYKELEDFIDGFNFKYFKGKEFTPYWDRVRKGIKNNIPNEVLWQNIVNTIIVADFLRDKIGGPLSITSSYRSPRYNAAIGGEKNSYHMKFMALDLATSDPKRLASAARKLRGCLFHIPGTNDTFTFNGGVGLYSTFVHIDTRANKADW